MVIRIGSVFIRPYYALPTLRWLESDKMTSHRPTLRLLGGDKILLRSPTLRLRGGDKMLLRSPDPASAWWQQDAITLARPCVCVVATRRYYAHPALRLLGGDKTLLRSPYGKVGDQKNLY